MGRFDYVKYDHESVVTQEMFKQAFEHVEKITEALPEGRAKSLLLTYLEIAYMWSGKAIRDGQIARNVQTSHVSERG